MIPLSDSRGSGQLAIWTYLIILANIFVFYLELSAPDLELFINQYALIPSQVSWLDPVSWMGFITSQFLHGGWMHIISNLWFLRIFGDNIEQRFGYLWFPMFYLAAGIVGGLSQYLIAPDSAIPMIGASGAIAGVLGAYLAVYPHHKIKTLVPIVGFLSIVELPATIMLAYWFITQLFAGGLGLDAIDTAQGGVAYFAHIGGFVFGFIIGKLWPKTGTMTQIE